MTGGTLMLLHWNDDDARIRAGKIGRWMEAFGIETRLAAKDWFCQSTDPGESLGGDVHLFGQIFEGGVADHPCLGRSALAPADRFMPPVWGRHVVVDGSRGIPRVRSDPSGGWPLWILSAAGLTVVTDHLSRELADLAGARCDINCSALAAVLVDAASATHLSMLTEVVPLIPGEALDLATGAMSPEWRPRDFVRRTVCSPAEELRAAVDLASSRMSRGPVLMQLSGGLDSAVVLSSVAASGTVPPSVNFATADAGGDESEHARSVAATCGAELRQIGANGFPDFSRIPGGLQGASPSAFGLDEMFENAVDSVALETGATAVMTGQGGDAVFFQPATPLVAVDRARAVGRGWGTWPAMLDDARRSRSSFWHHLFPTIVDLWRPAQVPREDFAPHLLTDEARRSLVVTDRTHPWVRGIEDLPPGKRMQIAMVANCQIFHGLRASGRTEIRHPLLSRPVLEVALAIPSYQLAMGDNDRGLARMAFGDRLPSALLERRCKGEASGHYSRAAVANLDFLRDYLLDGQLVKLGILDRDALSVLLTRDGLFRSYDYSVIPLQVSCEAWARAWGEVPLAFGG